jgi:hypothetical protein
MSKGANPFISGWDRDILMMAQYSNGVHRFEVVKLVKEYVEKYKKDHQQ